MHLTRANVFVDQEEAWRRTGRNLRGGRPGCGYHQGGGVAAVHPHNAPLRVPLRLRLHLRGKRARATTGRRRIQGMSMR